MDHLLVAADHPPQTQALHAKHFRDAACGDAALIEAGNRRHPLPRPFQPGIDLVNNKPAVVQAGNRGKACKLITIHQAAGRVVRIGHEDHACARRHHCLQRIKRKLPPGLLIPVDDPDLGAGGPGQHLGLWPAGSFDDDLVTGAKALAKRQIVGLRRTGGDQHVIGMADRLKPGLDQHMLAQARQALK